MKIFECGHCQYPLYFENSSCENCNHLSGYRDTDRKMLTFDPLRSTLISDREQIEYRYCSNQQYGVCNWLVEKDDHNQYCSACQLNRTVPNLSEQENFERWRNLEVAKHRLIYQLQKIGLALPSKMTENDGLCFDFVAKQGNPNLMTGHAGGVITILLREADSVLREQARRQMLEPYRTLIGHLRHEVGHYFWERLVMVDPKVQSSFREIFGDESVSYADALQRYYQEGAPADWQGSFISKYATSHPWEDWAETWAHYLHIMDMVETAHFFGLNVNPSELAPAMRAKVSFDPYSAVDFDEIIQTCMPLSFAVNSINRAMGIPDVYPFVVSPVVVHKMKFIHQLLLQMRK
ncbi:MAG: putative zinc-binding peptidase [Cyclobacteriaceae bacterium]